MRRFRGFETWEAPTVSTRTRKRYSSDEFGCGAAFALAGELFNATVTIDFETAVAKGWIKSRAKKSRRPDYAVRLSTGELVILEAKGTQSGAGYARDYQLPSACAQTAAVRVTGKNAPKIVARVASAFSLSFADRGPYTEAFVSAPDETVPELYEFQDDVLAVAQRSHYSRVAAFSEYVLCAYRVDSERYNLS